MQIDAKSVLESMNTAILVTNAQLKIIYANTAAEQLLSMSRTRLVTMKLEDIIDKNETALLDNLHQPLSPTFQSFSATSISLSPEPGNTIIADLFIELYNSRRRGLIAELHSLVQHQKLVNEVQRRSLHSAARDLVRNLAHEIKNPLGGIRGAAQLLEISYGNEKGLKDYTKLIIEQTDRLKALVDRLLGPQRPTPLVWSNIHYVLEKVVALVSMQMKESIRFEKDYDPSLPELKLDVDAMQQVFLNIINNACQAIMEAHTVHPYIKISTRASIAPVVKDRRYPTGMVISIANNGPEIPEHIRQNIFYPMVTTKATGNGLGLSIAQNIIERHHGSIECQSSRDITIFRIVLPLPQKNKDNPK